MITTVVVIKYMTTFHQINLNYLSEIGEKKQLLKCSKDYQI